MGLRVRWLGISGYEISDGKTIVLTDPVFTRPTLSQLLTGPIEADPEASAEIKVADYILINHAHYDHAADLPLIAKRTGAVVLGSRSALNLCRSRGIPEKQLREVYDGLHLKLGTFDVLVHQGIHTAIAGIDDPMSGTIPADAGPLWFWQYTNDGTFAYRLQANGTSLWFHPTSTLYQGERELWPSAKNLILGVTGEPFTCEKLKTMLDACQPRWVFPTHYDNFFFPRSEGLALMPEAGLTKVGDLIREYDPKIKYSVLDYDQTVYLPPD
jgi:L-ascorbate metabolism protein UlaG (beta-lactamase superfamily)